MSVTDLLERALGVANGVTNNLDRRPNCDFCGEPAYVDGRTVRGPWAYMCEDCFNKEGVGFGLGSGQFLNINSEPLK